MHLDSIPCMLGVTLSLDVWMIHGKDRVEIPLSPQKNYKDWSSPIDDRHAFGRSRPGLLQRPLIRVGKEISSKPAAACI